MSVRLKPGDAGHRWIKVGWNALVKEAGIEDLHFHDLRHTCASWLVMKGVHLLTVQRVMGLKSYQTTLRYAHLAPDSAKHAVEVLAKTLTFEGKKENDGHF